MSKTKPTEKSIIFNTPMVKAILNTKPNTWPPEPIDPTKPYRWQTRRIVKPQPDHSYDYYNGGYECWTNGPCIFCGDENGKPLPCPYGSPGDVLWVRETWAYITDNYETFKPFYAYRANEDGVETCPLFEGWKPSIHMPHEAARLFLVVKDTRVEKLQDITEEDAVKEGLMPLLDKDGVTFISAKGRFHALWDSIYAKRGYRWNTNPWVFVIEFMRINH